MLYKTKPYMHLARCPVKGRPWTEAADVSRTVYSAEHERKALYSTYMLPSALTCRCATVLQHTICRALVVRQRVSHGFPNAIAIKGIRFTEGVRPHRTVKQVVLSARSAPREVQEANDMNRTAVAGRR